MGVRGLGEEVVVVDQRDVGGRDDFAGEPPAVESVDGGHGRRDVGALDVDVALRRSLVHHDVEEPAVLGPLLDDVVLDLLVPVGRRLLLRIEHVGQHEALGGDRRARLLLGLCRLGRLQRN